MFVSQQRGQTMLATARLVPAERCFNLFDSNAYTLLLRRPHLKQRTGGASPLVAVHEPTSRFG